MLQFIQEITLQWQFATCLNPAKNQENLLTSDQPQRLYSKSVLSPLDHRGKIG